MSKTKDFNDFVRGMIVGAKRTGASISEMKTLKIFSPKSIFIFLERGSSEKKKSNDKDHFVRKRLVNERSKRRVASIVRINGRASTGKITAEINAGTSQIISQSLIRWTQQMMGFSSRVPLVQKYFQKTLIVGKEHRN